MSRNSFILIQEKLNHFDVTVRDEDGVLVYHIGSLTTLRKAIELANIEQIEDALPGGIVVKLRNKNWRG